MKKRAVLICRAGPSSIVRRVLDPLLGRPCWNVKPGWGSFLTMEFGRPALEIRDPIHCHGPRTSEKVRKLLARRRVIIHGEWHLWIYCCDWIVSFKGKQVGDSRSPRSYRRAASELDGQKLVGIAIDPRSTRTVFEFDLGGSLETRPYDQDEQWKLKEPSGHWFTVRADSRYCYANRWRPLPGGRIPSPSIQKLLWITQKTTRDRQPPD